MRNFEAMSRPRVAYVSDLARGAGRVALGCGDPRPARSRRGYTLVEMIVVVGITALVLTSVGVALHRLSRTDRLLRKEVVGAMALTRLSEQVRTDAHRAQSVERSGGGRLTLVGSDGSAVDYVTEASYVLRVVWQGAEVKRRERYRLPEKAVVRWETKSDQRPTFICLEIVRQTGLIPDADDSRRVDRIEAAVGLEAEYAK